ncbi:aminoacetone oxidase family FAD-binding enzyme [Pseudodesulfovibrio sp. JC047]|uniref:NAD(P)/FAD-dependent oxidoreductase n=1 Tax=Pseudodesulfovibrio sp. JC047 TaxID=2683199 RepID=UPI0013D67A15|nr:aminoacetone oxidase family FAD-binding enzyme [Pseudodesulfovibrio sp. JC047]NDV18830.1 aminoacetone oxidase family FAD-binding enzyme [Pseudodesulfovibrio sp. JC047]
MTHTDVLILGAGASGLYCAMTAVARGLGVVVLDHGAKAARKVRVSGGGKCNFTNLQVTHANYICGNPHFVKSAVARLSPWDVVSLLAEEGISYEEREHGQLFTDQGAGKVAGSLLTRCTRAGVDVRLGSAIQDVSGTGPFSVTTDDDVVTADALVIALGGPSWPQVGATDLGFRLAKQFGLRVVAPHPGLVPLVFPKHLQGFCREMAGNALEATVSVDGVQFTDPLLFTHKGVSGPATLQASSYWRPGQSVTIDFLPGHSVETLVEDHRRSNIQFRNMLGHVLPKRLPGLLVSGELGETSVSQLSLKQIEAASNRIHRFTVVPASTEGYGKAEVCVGGVDTDQISSKTMECTSVPGLYVIGEALDVTGHLGGFNLHWAFASGAACGSNI